MKPKPRTAIRPFGLAAVTIATAISATGANLTWDADTGTTGAQAGSGTWNTSNTNWWTGSANASWVNGTNNSGFDAILGGTDGTYTLTNDASVSAGRLLVGTGGYTLTNNGTNAITLGYANSTGSSTTDDSGALWLAAGKTLNIGSGADSTVVKLNITNTGFSAQLFVGGGSTLNINAGASVVRDNSPANGGIRFIGNGTVNLYGTLSLLQGNDGIRISERDGDAISFNVKSGGAINVNTTAGNESGASLWVAGGAAGSGSGNNTLTIESGGAVSVLNTTTSFGLTRNAGPTSTFNLAGTLTAPKIISLASTATFNFTGGTLKANATQASFMTGLTGTTVNVNSNSTIDNNGFNIGIGQAIGGTAGLTFKGAGTTTLTGTHGYGGATAVDAGSTLEVNGSLASAITVSGTLKGTGATSGSATFSGGSSLTVDPADEFAANGVNFSGATTLSFSSGLTGGNTYDVIDFGAGGLTSGYGNLVKTSRGVFSTSGTMLQFTAGSASTDTWNATSGIWRVGTTTPWANGSDNEFWNSDTVIFDDTPGADAAATVTGTVTPAGMTVNNPTYNHAWTGTGGISGTGSLTKGGAAGLTISTANSYSGGTTLNAGTLTLDNASAIGSGALNIAGGALDSTNSTTLSTNNAVNVSGDFAFTGTSNLSLGTGAVTLSGGDRTVTVAAGTLTTGRITNAGGGLTKNGTGTLQLNPAGGNSTLTGTLKVSAGTLGIGLNDLTATGLAGSGTIQNGSATTRWLIVTNVTDNTFSGALTDGGAGRLGFRKAGTGAMTLTGTNSYTDPTTLDAGAGPLTIMGANTGAGTNVTLGNNTGLIIGNTQALGTASVITLASNTTGTVTFKTDGSLTPYDISFGSGTTNFNVVLDSAGATAVTHSLSTGTTNGVGRGTVNISLGGAVTAGTLQFDTFNMGAGSTGTNTVINPGTGVTVSIGTATKSNNNVSQTLELAGAEGSHQVTGEISNGAAAGANNIAVVKSGNSVWTLSGTSTYTGATTVSAGTLLVTGALGATAVTVNAGANIGGDGTLGGNLAFAAGGLFDIGQAIADPLTVNGTVTFGAGFGIDNLTGVSWSSVADGSYTLIDGTATDFSLAGLDNFGAANAYDIGGGRSAYFEQGSLKLVVIPETSVALLAALGTLGLMRRRR